MAVMTDRNERTRDAFFSNRQRDMVVRDLEMRERRKAQQRSEVSMLEQLRQNELMGQLERQMSGLGSAAFFLTRDEMRIPIQQRNSFPLGSWDGDRGGVSVTIPAKPETSMLETAEVAQADLTNSRVGLAIEVEDVLGYTPLRKDVKAPSRLERCLAELEIETFKMETVDAYRLQMQKHFYAKARVRDDARQSSMSFGYIQTDVEWRKVDLGKYKEPVPEHILRKCVQIKRAIPEATFQVDELRDDSRVVDPFMVVTLAGESAYFEVWDEPTFEASL